MNVDEINVKYFKIFKFKNQQKNNAPQDKFK